MRSANSPRRKRALATSRAESATDSAAGEAVEAPSHGSPVGPWRAAGRGLLATSLLVAAPLLFLPGLRAQLWRVCGWTAAPPPPLESNEPAEFFFTDLLSGHWQFAGSSWQIGMHEVDSAAEGSAALSPPQPAAAPVAATGELPLSTAEDDHRLIDLFDQLNAQQVPTAVGRRRTIEHGGLLAALDTNETGIQPQVTGLQVITNLQGQRRRIELRPSGSLVRETVPLAFMELPSQAEILATRFDGAGQACGAAARVPLSKQQIRQHWTQKGWRVESAPASQYGDLWICQRDAVHVAALIDQSAGDSCFGLLLRVPDDTTLPLRMTGTTR